MASIDTLIVQLGLSDPHPLYSSEAQEGYSCQRQGRPVLLTCTRFQSVELLRTAMGRVELLGTVQSYRVLGYVAHAVVGDCLAVVEESGEKPVFSVIEERRAAKAHYSDAFLLEELKELVNVLATLQGQGLSHGAISPLSLYFSSAGFKISLCHPSASFPAFGDTYLSPAKRLSNTFHNPYKSDVYSLGAVFLALSLLRHPNLNSLNYLQEAISTELNSLSAYPQLQGKIRTMLSVNDCSRPDFEGLNTQLAAEPVPHVQVAPRAPGCLQCNADFPASSPTFPLWCTFVHGFCSQKCAENYILQATQNFMLDLITVKCSICGVFLESENLAECVGGKANLDQIKKVALSKTPVCMGCHQVGKETFKLECGCYFCNGDLTTAFNFFSRTPLCVNCNQPLDKDQLRHLLYKTPYVGAKK